MSKIFQLEGGQYEHPNEYKLVSTVRGTTILQPEFGTVIIEGDVIEASTHNTIQKNGVLASKVNVTMESTDTVLVPTDMTIESDLFNELKIILLFETGTTLPSNSFIKLKETNVPIANVNDYVVDANTPLLFLYFDSKFYAYKAGSGTSTGAESLGDLSDVVVTTPTNGQTLVYNGTNFVNQTISGGTGGASKLDDLSDVTLTTPTNGQTLVYNGTNFVNKTVEEPASKLDDLTDVTLTTPTNGQALVYNGTNFVNQTISGGTGGASKLDDLSDVTLTTPTSGQALVYNGTNFVNQTVEEPVGLLESGSINGTDPEGGVIPWHYTAAKQGKLCTVTFYLDSQSAIFNIQGMQLNFSAMQNAPAFNPSTQYDNYPINVYYRCRGDHFFPNNEVTITISSQFITFGDNQGGIDAGAFFTITYFTD